MVITYVFCFEIYIINRVRIELKIKLTSLVLRKIMEITV